jgi:ABC-type branched-subunit amino acid transport system ATPase component/branched-subunit amino acid ABC-type transport system permease component
LLPFVIAGLTTGSVYALAGVGLVLTYKTSGVFNFAHGALATVSAYLFYTLHVQHGMPWPIAAVLCVFVAGPVLGLAIERIARGLSTASLATRVVSTIGVLLIVQALAVIIYGTTVTRSVPSYLPTHVLHLGGTVITTDRLIVWAVAAAATGALFAYFRVARMGVAMRAVVDDSALLDVAGTSPVFVRRWAWMIGVTFASASGVLLVPFVSLDSTTLTFLVVSAFGAAALGGFSNIPGTYLGGLLIGIGASLATKYFPTGLLSGVSASLPFLVLFVVLLVTPRRRLAERAPVVPRGQGAWSAPWQFQATFGVIALVVLSFVPQFASFHISDYSQFLAITILFLSLGLLVRTSGQVSLCHVSFMAIGACAFSHLTVGHGWPWGLALVAAGLIAVPIGALLSIPAIRLSGLYLALATFGFGILLQYMFYTEGYMFGDVGLGVTVPMPHAAALGLKGGAESYYYLCLVLTIAAVGLVVAVNRSRLGRLLRALSDSPTGLATSGTSINVTRVLVFCLSAFLASIAGVLAAGAIGNVGSESYLPLTSLVYFALIIISLGGIPWYAMVAAASLTIVPSYITNANTSNWLQVLFGVFAVVYAITPPQRRELPASIRNAVDKLARRATARSVETTDTGHLEEQAVSGLTRVPSGRLGVSDLKVAFGGLVAVNGATIDAPTEKITGLIGPNGAGKTTVFNACSGLNRPSRGRITLDDVNITRWSPSRRARRGLGRTFQQMELFDNLTVQENVALGFEASSADANPLRHFASSPRHKRRIAQATDLALSHCDLHEIAERTAGSLSTGQRRLVELARCLAGPYQILLLDEPSSGLDRVETARFGEILRRVVDERGLGILLVEHDMALVTDICDYIYVLDFGEPIFQGTPVEVMSSPVVQAAYLGGEFVVSEAVTDDVNAPTDVAR